MVRVGGDVGDEFLGCEGEEAGEMGRGLVGTVARRWKAGEGEVVSCYGVGDLKIFLLERDVKEEVWGGSR